MGNLFLKSNNRVCCRIAHTVCFRDCHSKNRVFSSKQRPKRDLVGWASLWGFPNNFMELKKGSFQIHFKISREKLYPKGLHVGT